MEHPPTEQDLWFADEVLPHERDLRAWLGKRYPTLTDVDDLVQESFTRLLKAHRSGPIANPRAFLFVVARNLALNYLRHLRHEHPQGASYRDPLSIVDDVSTPPESIAHQEELQLLIDAVQKLPARCRQVMTLRKIYGFSQKEVARQLNISVNTVEVQCGIGLRKCIAHFQANGYLSRYKK